MKTVLFIGNSFTYYNDLPEMIGRMLKQTGDEYQVESLTKGGWYLSRYADPQDEMGRQLYENMVGRHWDYVILQDQSFNPIKNYESFLIGAKTLCEVLKPENILFYQTWAYEDGSEKLACTGLTYDEMHLGLKTAYTSAAKILGGVIVKVGDRFSECRRNQPDMKLYTEDNFHPSLEGTQVAAAEFFAAITGNQWR